MEANRRKRLHCWILLLALLCLIGKCDKLDGYSFPVYNTTSCPRNETEWTNRSYDLNCTNSTGYMCIPNEKITQLLEFCYKYPRIPVEKDICIILRKTSLVEAYSCKQFVNGCPDQVYWSNEIFKYPSCLSIGDRCFLAEPLCKTEGTATNGPTETILTQDTTRVYLGSTIINTTLRSTSIPDFDESNTWVWILVIGVFLLILLIPICALIVIFRRRSRKTLGEEIPLKAHENEIKESEENQELNDESLLLLADRKNLDKENIFGDRSTNKTDIDKNEEERGEMKSYVESLKECTAVKENKTPYLDKTNRAADSISEDNSKKEYVLFAKCVSEGINSESKQQEDSERISLEELMSAGIHIDGYEVWKTKMSEKYQKLSDEERVVLFLLICSDENCFVLENNEKLKKRISEMFGEINFSSNISDYVQELQSKGFVSIEEEKVTFFSNDVQDETMFDYIQSKWLKRKANSLADIPSEKMFNENIRCVSDLIGISLGKSFSDALIECLFHVAIESLVKYFRSKNYGIGKYIRCFPSGHTFYTRETLLGQILSRIIFKLGKDILFNEILDDKSLHSTISTELKIPEEVLNWDVDARKRYLEYLKKGKAPIYRARAMLVGCAGAGKTTLLERLQKKSMEDIKNIKSTIGLDVHNDIFRVEEKEGTLQVLMRKCEPSIQIKEDVPLLSMEKIEGKKLLSILDFGGQCMYYACHQIYLSKRAFYILVVDMSKDLEDVIDEELCDQKDTMFSGWTHKGI